MKKQFGLSKVQSQRFVHLAVLSLLSLFLTLGIAQPVKGEVFTTTSSGSAESQVSSWFEQAKLLANDGAPRDEFGHGVAVDENTIVIGAALDDDKGEQSGSAHVFVRNGSSWLHQAKLTASDGMSQSAFGESVAIDGDTIIVGARGYDYPRASGAVYVFTRNGVTWTEQTKLIPSDYGVADNLGNAVALDGDTAVIAAWADDDNGYDTGSVYVFTRSGGTWSEQAKLSAGDPGNYDMFGASVAVDGGTIMVGSRGYFDRTYYAVHIFTQSGTTWTEQAKLLPTFRPMGDWCFSQSVAVEGDTAVIGVPCDDDKGNNSGAAYIFTRSGTLWSQQAKLTADDGTSGDQFGSSVVIENENVLIGAWRDDSESGSVYVFTHNGNDWSQQAKLTASDKSAGDRFGESVAMDGSIAVIGAMWNADNGIYSGSAYVFNSESNQPPVAEAGGPYTIDEGGNVTFNASGSNDPDNNITNYEWDLDQDGEYDDAIGMTANRIYFDNGSYVVGLKVTDAYGEFDTDAAEVIVLNVLPLVNAGEDALLTEGDTFASDGSFSDPGADMWTATVNYGDGTEVESLTLNSDKAFALNHPYQDNGGYTVEVCVSDDNGGIDCDTLTVIVANVAPSIETFTAPINPMQVGILVETSATFTDPGVLDTYTATWDWGDGSTSAGAITEINGSGSVTGQHTYMSAGVYSVKVTVTDDDGDLGESTFQFVVIYDPDGGFVTGGGWINSPEGAYTLDPVLTGKATFGFVSKYQKGATIPTGQTEFQFHVADLSFKSTSYDWLVIAGTKAQYKGTGTIIGMGEYGFLLTAIDGSPDRFRIKIWDKATGEVIYDNQLGAEDTADPTTTIQGGSIVIHKAK